jgi:hypothetical protein
VLRRPARCAGVPIPASASGQTGRAERAKRRRKSAGGRQCRRRGMAGCEPSKPWLRTELRTVSVLRYGRSDLCSRHQQGSCGSSFVRLARDPAQSSSFFRKLSELSTSPNGGQRPEAGQINFADGSQFR